MTWRIELKHDRETGEFAVWCPEVHRCVSAGTTEETAKDNIREAIKLYPEESPIALDPGSLL